MILVALIFLTLQVFCPDTLFINKKESGDFNFELEKFILEEPEDIGFHMLKVNRDKKDLPLLK